MFPDVITPENQYKIQKFSRSVHEVETTQKKKLGDFNFQHKSTLTIILQLSVLHSSVSQLRHLMHLGESSGYVV